MQSPIVAISSPHAGWEALRATLRAWPAGQVLADVRQARAALAQTAYTHPSAILVDADLPDCPLIPLVGDLRAVSPGSKILVLGEREALQPDTLLALWHRGVAGYFVWEDLRPETVVQGISIVLGGDVLVGSRVVMEVLLAPERRQRARIEGLVLSAPEWQVLRNEDTLRRLCAQQGISSEVIETAIDLLQAAMPEDLAEHAPDSTAMVAVRTSAIAALLTTLTERERAVCELAADDLHYSEIAARLYIATGTVKTHAAHAKVKLGLDEREHLGPAYRRLMRG